MNPSQHWTQLVNQTMLQRRCGHSEAWRITAEAHPTAAALMSAFGRTRSSVSFFNSKIASELTPEKAKLGKEFMVFVNERMQNGLPYNQAYNAVLRDHPEFRAESGVSTSAQFANSKEGPAPVAGPQLKVIFRLPANCSQEEFEAAWHGNGDTVAPINPGKIFAGLVEYVQKLKSLDYEAAITAAKTAYPNLWDLVARIADEKI
jgi:hypothetical protein